MITDFLQAGAAWLNTARKRVALQSTVVKTEDGNFPRNATVVAAAQIVNPGEFKSIHDITLFLYDHAECVDINFKRGVTIVWQDEIYESAPLSKLNVDIAGGGERSTYSVSALLVCF